MLVLSRKHRESVVIGGSDSFHRVLKVTVLGIRGTNVKLGFDVDADVPVHRAEVWERIQAGQPLNGLPEDSVTPQIERDQKRIK
jgi:carbon storage regulator